MYNISVIIPMYNAEMYLESCLNSIISQTLSKVEIIIVDDASTDNSIGLIEKYKKKNSAIKLMKQEHKGAGAARNKGLMVATGKYIAVMDADDYYYTDDSLEALFKAAENNDALICGGNILNLTKNGELIPTMRIFREERFYDSIQYPMLFGQTRFLYNRSFLLDNHIFYPNYQRFEDPPFLLEAVLRASRYYTIVKPVYAYRISDKENTTTYEEGCDILRGIHKSLCLFKCYHVFEITNTEIETAINNSVNYLFHYIKEDSTEIWELIDSINAILHSLGARFRYPFSDYLSFQNYLTDVRKKMERLKEEKKIIVYGAGKVAREVLGYLDANQIIGVAATECHEKEQFQGYYIRRIQEITCNHKDAMIVIAAEGQNGRQMKQTLSGLGCTNYLMITGSVLKTAKMLED